ncbi:MAG: prepilin-type N-terminal cleavage/methylation domain-containing protein [Candidatus Hydrogenedentes bacterium]|nr:prepilin-type N-terminal cleavage/methylation domain-containing protein [Candidatus Hydrogenedentota bacterium]
MKKRKHSQQSASPGFTLAELLVATTIITIVMTALFTAYSSSIRLWRTGESNLRSYQDARTSLGIIRRELQNILPGAIHLLKGTSDELEFIAVVPPMDVEEGSEPRTMWIRYRIKKGSGKAADSLVREERIVESSLPPVPPKDGEIDRTVLKLGTEHQFELASDVDSFAIRYCWLPPKDEIKQEDPSLPPRPIKLIVLDELKEGSGMPQGIRIELTLVDKSVSSKAKGQKTKFTMMTAFRGPTSEIDRDSFEQEGGLLNAGA